jgi:hypothetical protein
MMVGFDCLPYGEYQVPRTRIERVSSHALGAADRRFPFRTTMVTGCRPPIHPPMFVERTNGPIRGAGAVVAARRNDDTDGRILGANGVEDMGAIIRSIAMREAGTSATCSGNGPR